MRGKSFVQSLVWLVTGTGILLVGWAQGQAESKSSEKKVPEKAVATGQVAVDPKLPDYKAVDGVSGNLKSAGSDTMNNLMAYWGEGFRKFYPNVQFEVDSKGSATAPPALTDGTTQLGPMSRSMKQAGNRQVQRQVRL